MSEDDWAQDAVTSHDESAHDDNSYTEQVNIINQWVDEDTLKWYFICLICIKFAYFSTYL